MPPHQTRHRTRPNPVRIRSHMPLPDALTLHVCPVQTKRDFRSSGASAPPRHGFLLDANVLKATRHHGHCQSTLEQGLLAGQSDASVRASVERAMLRVQNPAFRGSPRGSSGSRISPGALRRVRAPVYGAYTWLGVLELDYSFDARAALTLGAKGMLLASGNEPGCLQPRAPRPACASVRASPARRHAPPPRARPMARTLPRPPPAHSRRYSRPWCPRLHCARRRRLRALRSTAGTRSRPRAAVARCTLRASTAPTATAAARHRTARARSSRC